MYKILVGFEVFTAMNMKNAVSWDVVPCVRTNVLEEHVA
jgi:hypothetical protein